LEDSSQLCCEELQYAALASTFGCFLLFQLYQLYYICQEFFEVGKGVIYDDRGDWDVNVPIRPEAGICKIGMGSPDPVSGEVLETAKEVIDKGTIVRVEEPYWVLQIREGAGFSLNDRVRLANR
jgi:hypothetical protein